MHFSIMVLGYRENVIPLTLRGKTYPTILLQVFIKLLYCVVPLTLCPSDDIFSRFYDILSLIISTWRLHNENLKSCIWLIIYMTNFVSIFLRNLCFLYRIFVFLYDCWCFFSPCISLCLMDPVLLYAWGWPSW